MVKVDLYNSTYANFTKNVLDEIRQETFGEDFGQNSWTTADEHDHLLRLANIGPESTVLEIASGSGGAAVRLASKIACKVTGVDINPHGVATAQALAESHGCADRVSFCVADASEPLPFESSSFDALLCIDSMNHLPNRLVTLQEWLRVLRPGGRVVFTDPVVVTGPVTNQELETRSSIGLFVFVPPGVNEALIQRAGFVLVHQQDVTENAAVVASRWHDARDRHKPSLLQIEGQEQFERLQEFFAEVHRLSAERRLSRLLYVAQKPNN